MMADMELKKIDIDINMEIQFGEKVGHMGWLIEPKLFRPEAYPTCVSSKLCEFVFSKLHDLVLSVYRHFLIPWGICDFMGLC